MSARYRVCEVSVGAAGLTARPAVYDTEKQRTVKVFRRNERHCAERLANDLNAAEAPVERLAAATVPPPVGGQPDPEACEFCGHPFSAPLCADCEEAHWCGVLDPAPLTYADVTCGICGQCVGCECASLPVSPTTHVAA